LRAFEKAPPDVQEILTKPIKELGLKLEGSPLERYVQKLYRELDRKGVKRFRPLCYLTDEWGCPSGEPVIGIPFYLADPKLARLEKEMNDLEDEREILMYLRHEAGHAFNYAYELFKTPEWRELFGPFRRPYRDDYRPVPFSRRFVRHIAGWYAQKHPDEDFAETFAVWLTPGSQWRRRYKGWPALAKLRYVDRIARRVRDTAPIRDRGATDITVDEMESTVGEFYDEKLQEPSSPVDLPLDTDLADIFKVSRRRRKGVRPAADLLRENRKAIVDKVAYWTGVARPFVKQLVEAMLARVAELNLRAEVRSEREHLTEITAYATALAMSYQTRRKSKVVQP
jgi:Putative zinc-binding metallo-peptidase